MVEKGRLSRRDWLDAARLELQERGLEGVKVERLARRLGVSKGSFYWHFKNRGELLGGLLSYWEEMTDWLIQESSQAESPKLRMSRLFELIAEMEVTGEAAIFTWAKQDSEVKKRVKRVEDKRVGFLQELFVQHGYSAQESRERAQIGYLAFEGYVHRLEPDTSFTFAEFGQVLLDLLFAPTEGEIQ